jgi:hypothetical protein
MLFELSYNIEGATEKVYNFMRQFHNIKIEQLKFISFHNTPMRLIFNKHKTLELGIKESVVIPAELCCWTENFLLSTD